MNILSLDTNLLIFLFFIFLLFSDSVREETLNTCTYYTKFRNKHQLMNNMFGNEFAMNKSYFDIIYTDYQYYIWPLNWPLH